jgi:tetratricopeptide (TPR) repeat protein
MTHRRFRRTRTAAPLLICAAFVVSAAGAARPPNSKATIAKPAAASATVKRPEPQDDSVILSAPKDLQLQPDNARKADALAHFVEGLNLEENGESEKALDSFRKVLNVDPGEVELATRVAYLLTRQEDYPQAIDVLKDAIKAQPKQVEPYLQLSFLYAKYLKKTDQALRYANEALAIEPKNIDVYQRIYEVQLAAGDPKKALQTLDRATKIDNDDPTFWTKLGKLYAKIILKPDAPPTAQDLARLNAVFKKAADTAQDDPEVLKDCADFYAASQQTQLAIPLYLRVLELQPDDSNAREKLATQFVVANERTKAIEMLQEIIKEHPEKYQPYDLLAQLYEENARAFTHDKKTAEATAEYRKAVANYEQSLLINPAQPRTYLRAAQLLIAQKDNDRALKLLDEARLRFAQMPEITYLSAIALREAKRSQQAVSTFEEALHEGESLAGEIVNGQFYFDYGAAAEQAGLYDKAAELFKKAIELDPANAAEAYNYLGFMWAEQNTHLDEAADLLGRALEIDPNNGAYLDSMGWLQYRRGHYDEALAQLLRAAQNIQRDDAVVFEHIGDTYLKLKRVPQALDYWQKALTLDPENKKIAEKIDSTKTKVSKGEPLDGVPVH